MVRLDVIREEVVSVLPEKLLQKRRIVSALCQSVCNLDKITNVLDVLRQIRAVKITATANVIGSAQLIISFNMSDHVIDSGSLLRAITQMATAHADTNKTSQLN